MRLCKDCKYHLRTHEIDGSSDKCTYKSLITMNNLCPVTGLFNTSHYALHDCNKERQESTGFLGFFRDSRRCGVNAVNFEPKNKPNPPRGK